MPQLHHPGRWTRNVMWELDLQTAFEASTGTKYDADASVLGQFGFRRGTKVV